MEINHENITIKEIFRLADKDEVKTVTIKQFQELSYYLDIPLSNQRVKQIYSIVKSDSDDNSHTHLLEEDEFERAYEYL